MPVADISKQPEEGAGGKQAEDRLMELERRLDQLQEQLRQQRERSSSRPTTQITGMIQLDRYWTGEDSEFRQAYGALPDGTVFRRVRIGLQGTYGPWEYRIIPDFAMVGRPSLLDVYIGLNDIPYVGHLRIGYFAEPFGLEQSSSTRGVNTLERSQLTEVYGRRRRVGIMIFDTWDQEQGTWAIGVFRSFNDFFGDDIGPREFRSALTGRLTRLLWYEEGEQSLDLFHVGVSYSARVPQNREVQFQSRPEDRFGAAAMNLPALIDTGRIPAHFYQLLVGEALWIRGPFSVQGEYLLVPVSTRTQGAVYFTAWYVQASVFLTGDHRQYRRAMAVLDAVIPRRDFLRRENGQWFVGPGAWELIVRLSQADLNDGGITGGRSTNLTFGLAWYLNPHMRIIANYIQTHPTSSQGQSSIGHIIGLRTALEF
ncbi:MAG: porin [Gemmataceae bacterium]|nr:porin [Gemmataceae bacterium]